MLSKRILNTILVFVFAGLLVLCGTVYVPRLISVSGTSTSRKLPIYCVETDKPQISISFDSAWGNEYTQAILDILSAHNVKATFFMTGQWVEKFPEEVVKIYEAGHDLGNHSESHPYMSKLEESEQVQELMTVHNRVKELTGYDMFLFRAPYGDYNDQVISCVQENNYYPIQWDVDSLDWKDPTAQDMVDRIKSKICPGSIILMHNGATNTPEALPMIIDAVREMGYEFVPISELLLKCDYTTDHKGTMIPAVTEEKTESTTAEITKEST